MKKRFLAILLALVMCLSLAVPALAAGETTIKTDTGIGFDLSKPLLGTSTLSFRAPNEDLFQVPVYEISDGTIVVPKMIGNLPVEVGRELAAKMGDTYEEPGIAFTLSYYLYDWSGQGVDLDIDAAGIELSPEKISGPVAYIKDGVFLVECHLTITYPAIDHDDSSFVHGNGGISPGWARVFVGFKLVDDAPSYPVLPEQPTNLPTVEDIPAAGTAVATTQTVKLDGKDVQFQYYGVKDAKGNETNYVKVRDLALALNGTKAQFNVGWDGKISITSNTAYEVKGGEGATPYSGNQSYTAVSDTPVSFNGSDVKLTSFSITYQGGGYTYYKLRDLGQLLGFNVKWDNSSKSVVIETDKPFTGN